MRGSKITLFAFVSTLGLCSAPLAAQQPDTTLPTVSAPDLVNKVDIPYEMFTLKNGLTVLVHQDRKAPVIGVTVYYRVGSKNEPKGKTGFAHLFEHLMFGGSENVPNFDKPLTEAGSTPSNGSTYFDRTNYVITVPTGALDRALFMEADRMGRLLGAVTQGKLDAQRGVVQNEKRQGDNNPFGLVEYTELETLFPEGHPYGHSTIGSMADLDAASLATVHQWFKDNYGPNNAILVLAGDIDAKTAKKKVNQYFGGIARGPAMKPVDAPVPTLPARVDKVMKDRVANTRVMREWVVPGLNDPDSGNLDIAAMVLGGLASSRLDNAFVRGDQSAVSVTAGDGAFEKLGFFTVQGDIKPETDAAAFGKKLDTLIADYIAKGPTADEVSRAKTQLISQQVAALQEVGGFGGKASTLAEGQLYSNDPAYYKTALNRIAAATPASVTAAMQKWLTRPVFGLTIEPGERAPYTEASGPDGAKVADTPIPEPKLAIPSVGKNPALDFPDVQTATLANGIKLHYAQRTTIPMTWVSASFDAGYAAEPANARGTSALTYALMDAGTKTRNEVELAEAKERLGATINIGAGIDRTEVSMRALSGNFAQSLALMADIIRNPAFAPAEVDRLRAIQLSNIEAQKKNPRSMATNAFYPLLYGQTHPYATPAGTAGDTAAVQKLGSADLSAFHDRWIRPDNVELFVVSSLPLATVKADLDKTLGDWKAPAQAKGVKQFDMALPAAKPGIVLLDRPQSPQSVLLGGLVTSKTMRDDLVANGAADTILGMDFLSRINTDLREVKAWTYGASAYLAARQQSSPYIISTSVQADRTGDSIAALTQQITDFLGAKGVTAEEFNRTIKGNIAALPGQYETAEAVLGQMKADSFAGHPSNYVETLAARYNALTASALDDAGRATIDPKHIQWVVVGDRKVVEPQLKKLGLPLTVIGDSTAATPGAPGAN